MSTTLRAYHGKQEIKDRALAEMQEHYEADEIVQKIYWDDENRKGCTIGCLTHSDEEPHDAAVTLFGFPRAVSYLADFIFERLPIQEARDFSLRWPAAIPVGADLSKVLNKFNLFVLTDPKFGTIQYAYDDGKVATTAVAALLQRSISGDEPTDTEWRDAADAADAAREDSALAGRLAVGAAAWAANAAALAAALAADAAEVAGPADAAGPAMAALILAYRDEFIRLLETSTEL